MEEDQAVLSVNGEEALDSEKTDKMIDGNDDDNNGEHNECTS